MQEKSARMRNSMARLDVLHWVDAYSSAYCEPSDELGRGGFKSLFFK